MTDSSYSKQDLDSFTKEISKNKKEIENIRKQIERLNKNISTKETLISSLKKDGEKFTKNLLNSIENSKNNDLDRVICSLGIKNVGAKLAKILAKEFKNIQEKRRNYYGKEK